MGVDGIGEVGDRASEGQATGVYGAGFTAGKGARGGTRTKVSSDKELMEVGKKVASGGIRKEDVVTFFEDIPQRMKTRVVGGD